MYTRSLTLTALVAAGLLALSGCSSTPTPVETTAVAADALTVSDAWIKASDTGMTGAFGELNNSSATDITVVAASSDAAATVELHEVITGDDGNSLMQQKEGGFVVPAEGTHALEPGADHLMFMELTDKLEPGQTVSITLELSDGSTVKIEAPVKQYAGANESYAPGHGEPTDGSDSSMDNESTEH
ncbi:hypothetical protein GCM10022198_12230 [Klugiella xanthotipulae]|uniref:Copper(I)-binding protein n=1 Tax=Klugiella xanthotipulae TaxID=244735 RepID=A0A543I438_9MICO|nr:copper chaperone PCu(A)C [Klugiella xanthotipulae]TQM65311.1 hypothetical protein FB466_0105 [Klugiella xanthotipulae]